ncbi:MAG: DUF4012 domain-containing protein [Patescibacteria group bacterium]
MFLEPSQTEFPPQHHSDSPVAPPIPLRAKRKRGHAGVLIVGAFAVAILLAYVGVGATRIVNGALAARTALTLAKADIADTDFAAAQTHLTEAHDGLTEAQSGASMVKFTSYIPWLGSRYDAGVAVLDATEKTVDVLEEAVGIAQDVYSVVAEARATLAWQQPAAADTPIHDLPVEVKRELFLRLAASLPSLRTMQVKLDLATEDLATFHELSTAAGIDDLIAPFETVLAKLKTGVDFLVPFAGITREFAGLDGDRQFLLMFLNNTELRPTGGFLGTYGLLVIRDGDMKSLTTDDTYAIDALVAGSNYAAASPAPIATYLEQPVWYFRDSTWSPDFGAGAKDAIALLRQEIAASGQPVPQVHGAFGLTTTFLSDLLDFVGPITVEGQTFTAENASDLLEYQVEIAFEQQGITRADRKDIVGKLTNALLDKLLEVPSSRFEEVFALLVDAFTKKEIALYSTDSGTEAVLDDAGWSGKVSQGSASDVLMVVDANMASLKSDPVVKRTINYTVEPHDGGFRATAAITYKHEGTFDWKTSRYRTYTRIYVPAGSTLISSSGSLVNDAIRDPQGTEGAITTESEFGLTSFGTFTSIEPGQSRTLTFTYQLPASVTTAVAAGSYTLTILKQIGADPRDIVLHLDFNHALRSANPAEDSSLWGDDIYDATDTLDANKEYRVNF